MSGSEMVIHVVYAEQAAATLLDWMPLIVTCGGQILGALLIYWATGILEQFHPRLRGIMWVRRLVGTPHTEPGQHPARKDRS